MDITREQLYEMLWADGVGKTGKALGLKPQELQRICQDFAIPKPSSAYWYGILYEKNPQKTPLPASEKEGPIHTEEYLKKRRVKKEKPVVAAPAASPEAPKESVPTEPVKGKYPPRELPAEEPVSVYTVPDKLYAKDPLILDTKARLREENSRRDNPWFKKNPYKSTPEKWLDISVYRAQEDRALRVFQSIWRAAEARGYPLEIKVDKGHYRTECETFFVVREHHIRIQLKEINRRPKDDEERTGHNYMWTGTGKLKLVCEKESGRYYSYNNERIAAQDTEHTRIEDKIERIVEVLEEIADKRDQAEVERKLAEERRKVEEELKRQEEERKRQEEERLAKIEERREEERSLVRKLLLNAHRAQMAGLIRDYAAQFETIMVGRLEEEEYRRQLQWMREKADFMDPFIKRDDEWLRPSDIGRLLDPEIVKTTEERHTSYGYGSSRETTKSYWQIKNGWWNR